MGISHPMVGQEGKEIPQTEKQVLLWVLSSQQILMLWRSTCAVSIDILPTIVHKNLVYILGSDVKQTWKPFFKGREDTAYRRTPKTFIKVCYVLSTQTEKTVLFYSNLKAGKFIQNWNRNPKQTLIHRFCQDEGIIPSHLLKCTAPQRQGAALKRHNPYQKKCSVTVILLCSLFPSLDSIDSSIDSLISLKD